MSRPPPFGNPCLLGFDGIEQALSRLPKGGDGYPPYNVERLHAPAGGGERFRIVLAVAGFGPDQLAVTLEDGRLVVTGRAGEESGRDMLHRGIAARQFQRSFLIADGMEVTGAELAHGLLSVEVVKPEPTRAVRRIAIATRD